jgi:hypothetical protein
MPTYAFIFHGSRRESFDYIAAKQSLLADRVHMPPDIYVVDFVQHAPNPDGSYNAGAALNKCIARASIFCADWCIPCNTDWIVTKFKPQDFRPGHIQHGMLSGYPTADAPLQHSSVFAVPREHFGRRYREDLYPAGYWADQHWYHITCAGLPFQVNTDFTIHHIAHPMRATPAAFAEGEATFKREYHKHLNP